MDSFDKAGGATTLRSSIRMLIIYLFKHIQMSTIFLSNELF
jgi:hypothetical protein